MAGAAPGTVNGLSQVNFQVNGSQAYYLSVDGLNGFLFNVYTKP